MMSDKQQYMPPTLKVVEFTIERGYANSLSPSAPGGVDDFRRMDDLNNSHFHHYGANDMGETVQGTSYGW